jgi:hypothetical protein
MNLIIDAELTEPPSEVPVFRDVTLYSSMLLDMVVLLSCETDMKDLYWYWLKNRGAFDFVEDIINNNTSESGITMASESATIQIKHLRVENLNYVINRLNTLK